MDNLIIGYKFYKETNGTVKGINSDVAKWCDDNNAHIEDKGEYYEVIENDIVVEQLPVTEETTIADLVEALDILTNIVLGGE